MKRLYHLLVSFVLLPSFLAKSDCWINHRGVCIEMQSGLCPFSGGSFTWLGCPPKHICCIPPRPAATRQPPIKKDNCGVSKISGLGTFRIVGGWKALSGEWPWMVSLRKNQYHVCGAVIIDKNWMLTAAHCFFIEDYPQGHWDVVIGEYDLFRHDGPEQYRNISKVILHESFDNPAFGNDIALIKVDNPIEFNNHSNKICMPRKDESFDDMICSTTGWGTDLITVVTRYLHEVNLPIVPYSKCKAIYKEKLHPHNICTGFKAGKRDSCQGDSGGPLVCLKNGNHWVLAGLTSWGTDCAKANKPGVFTYVKHFLDWINDNSDL